MTKDNNQTTLTFQQILKNETPSMHRFGVYESKELTDRIECNDGESLSIQASQFAYCTPRTDRGMYTKLEVGFPSVRPQERMMKFCENPDKPTDTVYGYVPVAVIQEFIDLHGGEKAAVAEPAGVAQ